ncbi:MAG: hypothetical protein RID91_10040 [Azospirillaceae bacterium]
MRTIEDGKTNKDVYLEREGINLMVPETFTDAIIDFHAREFDYAAAITRDGGHGLLIEFGCADFRLLEARRPGTSYCGVDIHPPADRRRPARDARIVRAEARRFIRRRGLLAEIRRRYDERVLVVLPFNFLGTMDTPLAFLDSVAATGFDLLVDVFNTTETATRARIAYYDRCGIAVERVERSETGVALHCANGFVAQAFDRGFLAARLAARGYRLTDEASSPVWRFLHWTAPASSET